MIEHDEYGELIIPSRRLAPTDHLSRAAKADIGSPTEQYHLLASIAESLARIEQHLKKAAAS